METFLIDTNVFIAHFRGKMEATEFLEENKDRFYISYITAGELIQGVQNKQDLALVEKVINNWQVDWGSLEIQQKSLEILKEVNLKNKLGILDSIIATTALENKSTLVTLNGKHFHDIKGLKLLTTLRID